MSRIVLGVGTSHSVLLTVGPELWAARAAEDLKKQLALSDGRTLSYADLLRETQGRYAEHATLERFSQQYDNAQRALDRLADDIEAASPDIVVIIGDDQEELFNLNHMPAVAIYYGADVVMHPLPVTPTTPAWASDMRRGFGMDTAHRYPGAPDFAMKLIDHLVAQHIDLGASANVPEPDKAGFGHAYGFVVERLFKGRQIPIVPILLNTYYPPNVPRPARCLEIGRALGRAIAAVEDDSRVVIVASGGLSHFVTDAALDSMVLESLGSADSAALAKIPPASVRSGSSEILNWILAAGALEGIPLAWSNYVPVYRTPAGTGVGLGFCAWNTAG